MAYTHPPLQKGQWSIEKARQWHQRLPHLVGANYTPASAINQLEMWQEDTFDAARIDWELGIAKEKCGMNTMRIFLHDLLWKADKKGFKERIDISLDICAKHDIKPMMVLFDSCWDPHPKLGKQKDPVHKRHNSGWVQSPGALALVNRDEHARLEDYISGVADAFAKDDRILLWDIWNEPEFPNRGNYGVGGLGVELPEDVKEACVLHLIPQVFKWVRSASPIQPLTSGIWDRGHNDWSDHDAMKPVQKIQMEHSDVASFHNYSETDVFEKCIKNIEKYERPIFCTEYMARTEGSRFETHLPMMRKFNVAAINWGLFAGKTGTNHHWRSWSDPDGDHGHFHDIFWEDGTEIVPGETEIFKVKPPAMTPPSPKMP